MNRYPKRLCALAALVLPLLVAQAPAPASYKYAKPDVAGASSAYSKSAVRLAAAPKVTLKLVDPAHPALLLINETGFVAKDVEFAIALWKAETLEELYASEGKGPATLLPREAFGPLDLFNPSKISLAPKPGDKLVGNLSVSCRICARGYSYWVYIDWGKGGWYSEIAGIGDGKLVVPKGLGPMPPGMSPQLNRTELLKRTLVAWVAGVSPEARVAIAKLALPSGLRLISP
jgi:hypothetical protein